MNHLCGFRKISDALALAVRFETLPSAITLFRQLVMQRTHAVIYAGLLACFNAIGTFKNPL
jgi:hypothetical protein